MEAVRRDIVHGCIKCPDFRTRYPGVGNDANAPNRKSAEYHILTLHGITDWKTCSCVLGHDVRYSDGATEFVPLDGASGGPSKSIRRPKLASPKVKAGAPSTKTANRVSKQPAKPTKSTKPTTPVQTATCTKPAKPVRSRMAPPTSSEKAEYRFEAAYQDAFLQSLEDAATSVSSRDSFEVDSPNTMASRQQSYVSTTEDGSTSTTSDTLSSLEQSLKSSLSTTPENQVTDILLLISPADIKLSEFDKQVLAGQHGEEMQNFAKQALYGPAADDMQNPRSLHMQWIDLVDYLVARGNYGLKDRGQGLRLVINKEP